MDLANWATNPTTGQLLLAAAMLVLLGRVFLPWDRLLLLVASSVLALLTGEVAVRTLDLRPPEARQPIWEEAFSEPGEPHPFVPGSRLVYRYPDDPRGAFDDGHQIVGTINRHGFRGPEVPFEKPAGVRRVVMLGDSFTLGIGVRDEHTLPRFVERELAGSNAPIEVINLGRSASSTPEQVEILESFGLSFAPDVVVLVVFLNDSWRRGTLRILEDERKVWKRVRRRFQLADLAIGAVSRWRMHHRMIEHYHEGYRPDSPGWLAMQEAMLRAKDRVEGVGGRLVVALHPVLIDLDGDHPFEPIHEEIGRFCRASGLPFIDLLPPLRGRRDRDLWVHPVDHHPNEVTHEITGRAIAGFLRDENLLVATTADTGPAEHPPAALPRGR